MRARSQRRDPGADRAGPGVMLVALLLVAACGRADETVPVPAASPATATTVAATSAPTGTTTATTTTTTTTTTIDPSHDTLVAASDVEIVGGLTPGQRAAVDWALDRFDEAGLLLPARIEVAFEPGAAACGWSTGRCHPDRDPPEIRVCTTTGDAFFHVLERRMTLLHELAHVWHWAQGDGETWLDLSDVVGGGTGDDSLPAVDRTEERVAAVMTWGLLDQLRRPVPTDLTCIELYRQFCELTGHEPLGPIEPVCVPPEPAPVRPGPPGSGGMIPV